MADYNARGYTGINENTAPKHFAQLKEEGYDVSWSHFWAWARKRYRSIPNDHAWIPVGALKRYFADLYEGVAEFNRLFAIHEKRKRGASNAYDAPKRSKKRNGSGNSRNGSSETADMSRQAQALRERIQRSLSQAEERQAELREALGQIEQTVAQLGEES